jgi:chromosome segregation protein
MYLKELTINGFKSFAKKSELEFSAPITAIVGPNGSGKSNVAESFRFALGEQSPSRMRGKKGEDLIWGGSESVARANRASVAVVFNNEKKLLPLDFDEVTVERIVNRDGSNEYFINGSRTRLRDIHELFAAANIGQSGHHIISQGEADRILSANPRERREMIEEALGLKVYQYKKQESEKKLEKTLENIAHVESLRREVAPHLRFLERQVKKLEKSLELKEALKLFYASYLKREDTYLAFHRSSLDEARKVPEARRAELEKALSAARAKLSAGERDDKRDALVALERDIGAARDERQQVMRQLGSIEGQLAFLERRREERRTAVQAAAHAPVPYEAVARAVEEAAREAADVPESADASRLREAMRGIVERFRGLLLRAADGGASEDGNEARELQELQREKTALDGSLASVASREDALQQEYEALRASIEAEHSASREAEREVFAIMNEQRELEHELARIADELRANERGRDAWKRELAEAVALVGSAAGAYRDHVVCDEHGAALAPEAIATEDAAARETRRRELEKLKIRLEELGGGAGDDIMKEYGEVKGRDEFLEREIADLAQSVTRLETLIADLSAELNEQFLSGIEKIRAEFNRFFVVMFGGGSATLVRAKRKVRARAAGGDALADDASSEEAEQEDEGAEGIELEVKLPNKRVRGLDMLSGGERALTSIALIFAMSQVNPPPFIILDETDAALDEANSRRYGDMIETLAKRSQLILITHNRETMSRAGVLYGVTMGGDGVSKLLSVKLEEAVQVAK